MERGSKNMTEIIRTSLSRKKEINDRVLVESEGIPLLLLVANNQTLNRCYIKVGNGNEYPDIYCKPSSDLSRVYRDVMSYV